MCALFYYYLTEPATWTSSQYECVICAWLSDCTFSLPQLIVFSVQYIQHVTEMCVRMEALVVSTSLSTCVNVLQHTVDHSARWVLVSRLVYILCLPACITSLSYSFLYRNRTALPLNIGAIIGVVLGATLLVTAVAILLFALPCLVHNWKANKQ